MLRFNLSKMVMIAGMAATACVANAQPGTPVYGRTVADATTNGNAYLGTDLKTRWTISAGADSYQNDIYERPTASGFSLVDGRFASEEYHEYLDIQAASVGFDNRFLYVSIDLVGFDKIDSTLVRSRQGLNEKYGFRFSNDPDGRFGYLVKLDQPETKNQPNTIFGQLGVSLHLDTNGDVGGAATSGPTGLTVTKSDNGNEESGLNGYDSAIGQDGVVAGNNVGWQRISPTDATVIEAAIDYVALGLTRQQIETLRYFDVEAVKGGPSDPQNRLWNDVFTNVDAGSPNQGPGNASEFGTPGTGGLSEVDTVRLGFVGDPPPPPACPGDYNNDGAADISDLIDFVGVWSTGDPSTDINNDGVVDIADILDFVVIWSRGC